MEQHWPTYTSWGSGHMCLVNVGTLRRFTCCLENSHNNLETPKPKTQFSHPAEQENKNGTIFFLLIVSAASYENDKWNCKKDYPVWNEEGMATPFLFKLHCSSGIVSFCPYTSQIIAKYCYMLVTWHLAAVCVTFETGMAQALSNLPG